MIRRKLWSVGAGLLLSLVVGEEACAQKPRKIIEVLDVDQAIWSLHTQKDLPAVEQELAAEELAPALGLEAVTRSDDNLDQLWRHSGTGMLFAFIPGGTFKMGSNYSDIFHRSQVINTSRKSRIPDGHFDSEQPQQAIYLSPYFIGIYEVRVAEYRQFLEAVQENGAEAYNFPTVPPELDHTPYLYGKRDYWGDNKPVAGIHWVSAFAFCRWMGGRLPSEAEWEKAARGTDGRIFPWGNRFDPMRCNTKESLNFRTVDVGTYGGGRSPFGCFDMAGNVAEFVLDAFHEATYRELPKKDPCLLELAADKPSNMRGMRGGSWNLAGSLVQARVSNRARIPLQMQYSQGQVDPVEYLHIGFRVVLSPLGEPYPEEWWQTILSKSREIHAKQREKQQDG
jgi:formylglycine-generating enzyme required for sulfatase activity